MNEKWGNYSSFKGKKKNEFKESKLCWIKVDYRIKNDVVRFGKGINQITFKCNILCDLKKNELYKIQLFIQIQFICKNTNLHKHQLIITFKM